MSEILSWAFVIVTGGFFMGMMIYMFYLGLRPAKKNPMDNSKSNLSNKNKT